MRIRVEGMPAAKQQATEPRGRNLGGGGRRRALAPTMSLQVADGAPQAGGSLPPL